MADKNKLELIATLDGKNISSEINKTESRFKTFGSSVKNVFTNLDKHIQNVTQNLGMFGTAVTALSSGMALKKLFSLHDYMPIEDSLLRMQANFNMTAKEIDGFKNKLASMAGGLGEDMPTLFNQARKLSVAYAPEDILKIMEASSLASHAMGQDIGEVSERVVQLMKIYRKTPDEARAIAESLGASNLSAPDLDVALQRATLMGGAKKDYREVIGFFSGLSRAGIDSTRTVMRYEGAISALFEKADKLKGVGINPMGKSPLQLLEELGKKLPELEKKYGKLKFSEAMEKAFGPGAAEGIAYLYAQIDKLRLAQQDQGNAAQIAAKRAAAAQETWGEQLKKIKGSLDKIKEDWSFIYDLAKKPVKFLADSPALTKGLGYGVAGLSAILLGGLAYGKGRTFLKNLNLGKTAAGVAEGKLLQAATGVTPVFVTNWPGGGAGAGAGGPLTNPMENYNPSTIPIGGAGKFGKVAGIAGKASLVAGAGMAGWEIGTWLKDQKIPGQDFTVQDVATEGMAKIFALFSSEFKKNYEAGANTEIKNNIPMNIYIDPNTGKTVVENQGMNTKTDINVKRTAH